MLAISIKNLDECLTVQKELFNLGFTWEDGDTAQTYPHAFVTHIGVYKDKRCMEFLYSEVQEDPNFIEVTLEDILDVTPTLTKQELLRVFEEEKAKVLKVLTDVTEHINTNNFKKVRPYLSWIDDDSSGKGEGHVLTFECVDKIFIGEALDYLERLMKHANKAEDTQNRHKLLAIPIKSPEHAKQVQKNLLGKGFRWRNKEHNTINLPDFITHIGIMVDSNVMVYIYDAVPKYTYTEVNITDLPM